MNMQWVIRDFAILSFVMFEYRGQLLLSESINMFMKVSTHVSYTTCIAKVTLKVV